MLFRLADLGSGYPAAFILLLLACAYFLWMAAQLSIIDARHHLLPNRIVFPSYAVAAGLLLAAALASGDLGAAVRTLAGGALLGAFYLLLRLLYPAGMGLGDVKLAGVLGLYLGFLRWDALLWGTVAAFLLGGLWGAALMLTRRATGKTRIPFGPFMLAGTLATMVLAPA